MKKLQRYASYCSKQQHEAEDLLQDALLEAVRQGRAELSLAVNLRWLHASIPGNVDLVFFKGEVKIGSSPVIVFELTEDIEQVVSNLAEAGVTIVTPVSHAPGGLSADFLDPDGYILSVYQESA